MGDKVNPTHFQLKVQLTSSFRRRSATMFKAETRVLAAMGTPFELQSTMDGEEKTQNKVKYKISEL